MKFKETRFEESVPFNLFNWLNKRKRLPFSSALLSVPSSVCLLEIDQAKWWRRLQSVARLEFSNLQQQELKCDNTLFGGCMLLNLLSQVKKIFSFDRTKDIHMCRKKSSGRCGSASAFDFNRQSKEAAHKEKIITKEKIYVVRQNISSPQIKLHLPLFHFKV